MFGTHKIAILLILLLDICLSLISELPDKRTLKSTFCRNSLYDVWYKVNDIVFVTEAKAQLDEKVKIVPEIINRQYIFFKNKPQQTPAPAPPQPPSPDSPDKQNNSPRGNQFDPPNPRTTKDNTPIIVAMITALGGIIAAWITIKGRKKE